MTRLEHTVVVDAVDREWFADLVELAVEVATDYLGRDEFPLVGGRPLEPGARYETEDGLTEFTVTAWDTRERVAGTLVRSEETALTMYAGELAGEPAARTLTMSFRGRPQPGGPRMHRFDGELRADPAKWWERAARGSGEPPVTAWVRHRMFRGDFGLAPAPGPDGRWSVGVTARLRGRGAGWLLSAFLVLGKPWLRRLFATEADRVAADWDRTVAQLRDLPVPRLRERILAGIREETQSSRKP